MHIARRVGWKVRDHFMCGILFLRYHVRRAIVLKPKSHFMGNESCRSVGLIDLRAYIINLESREDRLHESRKQLEALGLKSINRWPAYYRENGALGCSLSHASILRNLKFDEPILICEDDVEFIVHSSEIEEIVSDFMSNPALDVLCLGNNPMLPPIPVSKFLSISHTTQTTSCYLVKPKAIGPLAKSAEESAQLLAKGISSDRCAVDQNWKKLQRSSLIFSVPRTKVCKQRASYSDIEGRWVVYDN